MAVAELPLPPFPYEKDFFGSPFPKGGKKALCRFSERNRTRRNQMDEQEKEIEEIMSNQVEQVISKALGGT